MEKFGNDKAKMSVFVESSLVESYYKIFIVNVNTGNFEVYKNNGLLADKDIDTIPDIYTYIKKIVTDKIIYREYAAAFLRFSNPEYVQKCVFSGEKRIVQSYRRRTDWGDKWVTFAIISGQDVSPENPMVLFTWREADSDTITLLDTLPTVSALYDTLIRLNLTNNTYEIILADDEAKKELGSGVINMAEWQEIYSKLEKVAIEDMNVFNTDARTEGLQKYFSENRTPISFRFCRETDDEPRWMKLEIAPSVEYSEENQILLLSLKDVHEEYIAHTRSREELIDNMSRDALTNLFNRLKFKKDIESLKKSSEPLFTCLYIDVNGLHELNNLLGHQKGDEMLCCVADTLCKYYPDEKIYRIGGDEFVVTSTALSKSEAELIIEEVRRDLLKDNYEISVGIATGTCGEYIEKIVGASELEMRDDKTAYYKRNGDRRRKRQMNEELEQMLVEKQDNENFLNIIASRFSSVYIVDLAYDTIRHIYIPEFFSELLEETNSCFSAAMQLYVDRFVKPEYHDKFDDIINFDKLDQKLNEIEAVQFTYEKTNDVRMTVRILKVDRQQKDNSETIWIFEEDTPDK